MRHADDHLLNAGSTRALDEVIEEHDERLGSLEREALLTDVLGVQVALEALGRRQLSEDVALLLGAEALGESPVLELRLQPQPLLGIRHMREFRPDVAAVDVLELRQDVPKLHAPRHRLRGAAGHELGVEVPRREAEVIEVEHPRARARRECERVDRRDEVPAIDPHLDEPRDRRLLRVRRRSCATGSRRRRRAARNVGADRTVGALRARRRQPLEVALPLLPDTRRLA